MGKNAKKKQIKGTLYFAFIAIIITPFVEFNSYLERVKPFDFDPVWRSISNINLPTYNKDWTFLVQFEFIGSLILLLFSILLIILFVQKTRHFSKIMLTYFILKIIFITFVFYFHATIRGPEVPTLSEIRSTGILLLFIPGIWIPYYLLSERVNETFIY